MDRAITAHASGVGGPQAARACLDRLRAQVRGFDGFALGVLYATDALASDLEETVSILRNGVGVDRWIGAVGMGVMSDGPEGGREYHDMPAIAVMLIAGEAENILVLGSQRKPDRARFMAAAGRFLETRFPGFGVAHGDPFNPAVGDILSMVSEASSCFLVGGLSASPSLSPPSKAGASRGDQVALSGGGSDAPTGGGLSGALFGGALEAATGLTQGCRPIGPVRKITEARGNVVVELNGRPALDGFIEDIGPELAGNPRKIGGLIFAALPGGSRSRSGQPGADYIVRNLMGLDPERGWIAIGDQVEPGDDLMFCRRDRASATADMERMLIDLKARAGKPPRAGFYHSCTGRGPHLFDEARTEIRMIEEAFGHFPLIGHFGNGEISADRIYGYTGVLSLIL